LYRRANTEEFWQTLCAFEGFLRYTSGRNIVNAFGPLLTQQCAYDGYEYGHETYYQQ
jgi:hypothetical protein